MSSLNVVSGVLVLVAAVALVLVRRSSSTVAALRTDLQTERAASAELRERAALAVGQVGMLERALSDCGERAGDSARRLEAAETRVNELTGAHAEATTGLSNSRARVTDLTEQLARRAEEMNTLNDQVTVLRTQQATSDAKLESAERLNANTSALLSEAQIRITQAATQSATQALSEKGQELQAQSRSDLNLLLTPFAEKISAFQAKAEQLYGDEATQRLNLTGVLQQMAVTQQRVAEDYAALARAMKGNPKTRGDLGEMILDTVLQSSGLEEGVHYLRQESIVDESGERVRPDVVMMFPGDRHLVVDSKLSLVAWQEAMNCGEDDPEGRKAAMDRHVAAVRAHVRDLSDKNYPKAIGSSALEVSIAFVAMEGALASALGADPGLQAFAFQRGVAFASPNTLMALLVVVERLWTRDKLTRTAKEIAETGARVLDAVSRFVAEFEAVGKKLDAATDAYSSAKYCLQESRHSVVQRTRRLVELGVKGKTPLPEQLELDEASETAGAPELTQLADEDAAGFPPGLIGHQDGANGGSDVPF